MHDLELDSENLSLTALIKLDEIELSPGKRHPQFNDDRHFAELKFWGRISTIGKGYLKEFGITEAEAKGSTVSLELEFGDSDIHIPDELKEEYVGWLEVNRAELVRSPEFVGALHFRMRVKFEYEDLAVIMSVCNYELKIEPSLLGYQGQYLGRKDNTVLFVYIRKMKISPILKSEN